MPPFEGTMSVGVEGLGKPMKPLLIEICISNPVFHNLFLRTAHPTFLTMAREGTPQNFALRKGAQNNTGHKKMRVIYVG
jgi:hypothetical protein